MPYHADDRWFPSQRRFSACNGSSDRDQERQEGRICDKLGKAGYRGGDGMLMI